MTRVANTFNEYGTPVTMFQCGSCKETFTVCPAVDPKHDDQWVGCLADTCASYDPDRDGDKLFDAGKVHRVGDRSHFQVIEGGVTTTAPKSPLGGDEAACGVVNQKAPDQ